MSRTHLLWLLAAVGVQLASAHPASGPSPRTDKRAALLERYRFNTVSTYTTLDQNNDGSSTASLKRGTDADEDRDRDGTVPSYVRAATSRVLEAVPGASFRLVDDYYVGANAVGHVHFQQVIDGTDVDNAHFKVNVGCQVAPQSRYKPFILFLQRTADRSTKILENGTVLSLGHSFHSDSPGPLNSTKRDESGVTPLAAFEGAVELLDLPFSGVAIAVAERADGADESYRIKQVEGSGVDPTAKLVYVTKDAGGSLTLAWRVETDTKSSWLVSYIDAASGNEVMGVTEYTNTASYEAL